jgi:hypothetical protein
LTSTTELHLQNLINFNQHFDIFIFYLGIPACRPRSSPTPSGLFRGPLRSRASLHFAEPNPQPNTKPIATLVPARTGFAALHIPNAKNASVFHKGGRRKAESKKVVSRKAEGESILK